MESSEKIDKVLPALLQAQQAVGHIGKDSRNPHFKSKYASLESILTPVRVSLAEVGCVLTHSVKDYNGKMFTVTKVYHAESAQWVSSWFPFHPKKEDPQGEGSALTYARRYGTMSIMAIAPSDDDDGNAASRPQRRPAQQPQRTQPMAPTGRKGERTFSAPVSDAVDRPSNPGLRQFLLSKIDDAQSPGELLGIGHRVREDLDKLNLEDARIVREHYKVKKGQLDQATAAKEKQASAENLMQHIGR